MIFTSYIFAIYLPVVFAVYWMLKGHLRLQNFAVVAASYVFYGWWDWRFTILIAITSVWAWGSGLFLDWSKSDLARKWVVALALVVNLGILCVFKYCNFFLESAAAFLNASGVDCGFPSLKIILPVGISFYTFQALGYVIDIYRREVKATGDLIAFMAFVSFFPQLVAGPIERARNLLPQFLSKRSFDYSQAVDGLRQMLWGFAKKMVVADNCAALAERIFNGTAQPSGFAVAVGALAFTLQIYGDFSGYSDIAIGCAKLFGIKLKPNFAFPYFSRDIAEFWRRWHMSLNTWFRDYLYIPLGGSRTGTLGKIRNIYVIFLVSGLWHGANWTFVAWGAFHATLFLPLMLLNANRRYVADNLGGGGGTKSRQVVEWAITFCLVAFGWLIFRAPDLSTFSTWIGALAHFNLETGIHGYKIQEVPWLIVAFVFVAEFINRKYKHALERLPASRCCRWFAYLAILSTIVFYRGGQTDFIYFQF